MPLALSMGDPLGIGPEILARAFARGALAGGYVVGDLEVMRRAARCVAPHEGVADLPVVRIESPSEALAVSARCVPVWQAPGLPDGLATLGLGHAEAAAGAAAAACIRVALAQVRCGAAAALVTAPIHKEALAAAGEPYPGHTELLQAECGGVPVRMMLANEELRVVLTSIHVSLRQAIEAVTRPQVLETIRIADIALRRAGIAAPRLAVAGLNPHAGEGGLFGSEEREQIAPAIADARAAGVNASGPYAPDTVFMRARAGAFDAVIAMYHDQGLIPVKYLGLEQGVNVTLGLPVVRTSPDHGTAFDIAGLGIADPASLIAAARMARRLSTPAA